ncbi:hypothetical protein [Methanosarcina sp. 2.H.A.1B.4]|uniref:DUF7490 domain-containing protein n=1 Tax=Methanosarcina sp. 2.H.A.1B.4 TaxID=1483600 RepID=UPI0012DFEE3D|nr:hypothetical protein [Methanosarcina sp. 2.H.A.1B.4]
MGLVSMGFRVSIKSKKSPLLFFIGFFISISLVLTFSSGCFEKQGGVFREYEEIFIQDVDVMSTPQGEGALLTVTPYIRNDQNTDSSMLSVKVKIIDQETRLIVAEKDLDMGYIKARSLAYNSVSLGVADPGDYEVEVQLFKEGQLLDSGGRFVTIKTETFADQPADILLTDMNLVITQFTDRDAKVVVDISPGVYNQGGDSKALTMVITARTDPYTAYTESDELGIVKGSSRLRGHVRFVLLRRDEYTFSVTVEENGREIVTSEVPEPIKMDQIERQVTKNYPLMEEGMPVEAPEKEDTPGFEGSIVFAALLLTACVMHRKDPKSKKDGNEELYGWRRR